MFMTIPMRMLIEGRSYVDGFSPDSHRLEHARTLRTQRAEQRADLARRAARKRACVASGHLRDDPAARAHRARFGRAFGSSRMRHSDVMRATHTASWNRGGSYVD